MIPKLSIFNLICLIIISIFVLTINTFGQVLSMYFEILDTDTLDGYHGYLQIMKQNSSLHATDFYFEENSYVRWYAYNPAGGDSTFILLPDSTYIVKQDTLIIGDSWTSFMESPTIATVIDTTTISTPAGVFFTYIIEQRPQSSPDSIIYTSYSCKGIGTVKFEVIGMGTFELTDYMVVGGAGYHPLDIGNWWRFDIITNIENKNNIHLVSDFYLSQNFPNPFNPSTKIKYTLPNSEKVKIEIFNLLGQKVETLLNKQISSGSHEVEFNSGNLPSGIYLYRISAGDFNDVKKMVLLR